MQQRLFGNEPIKAISLWQPWAWLMAVEAKRFETRSWQTTYRGPVIIHAAKTMNDDIISACKRPEFIEVFKAHGIRQVSDLPFGAALAIGNLERVLQTEAALKAGAIGDRERAFGDYSPGRFAWEFTNVWRFPEPVIMRGYQGLWNVLDVASEGTRLALEWMLEQRTEAGQ